MSARASTGFSAGLYWACAGRTAGILLLTVPLVAAGPVSPDALGGNHPDFWSFTAGLDGESPRGDLLADSAGNLYGTASGGGSAGAGTVFMATPNPGNRKSGALTTLYSFTGGADGSFPSSGLAADSSGAFYGTAMLDGAANGGTVFELTPPTAGQTGWAETTLWSFGTTNDGRNPAGTPAFSPSGSLFGTTMWGGAANKGSVFVLHPPSGGSGPWTERVAYSFTGGADGGNPMGSLVFDAGGHVFGTTTAGGLGAGTVFELTLVQSQWQEQTLWSFTGGTDGASPSGTLLPDGVGGFYGTTEFGGVVDPDCNQVRYPYYGAPNSQFTYAANAAYVPPGGNGCGLVFHLSPPQGGGTAWTETVVWQFAAGLDGANPVASLLAGPGGTLYGLNTQYGQAFWGTEFLLTPPASGATSWSLAPLASFDGKAEGFYPHGTPVLGLAGRLYGSASVGGKSWKHVSNYGYGTVFSSTP